MGFQQRALFTDTQVKDRVAKILAGERSALSRTVTLIESARLDHREAADIIMKELLT